MKAQPKKDSGYTLNTFLNFLRDLDIGFDIHLSEGVYAVTIFDKGNKKYRFHQKQFQGDNLQLMRNNIRNYLSTNKIKLQ